MQKIKFLGASGEVTGSSYLLTSGDQTQILIDFGMFQGGKETEKLNYQSLMFKPSNLKGVFLTHAHLDHCGRLPLLVYGGYFGKIYMTAPTYALIEIILNDSAKIAKHNPDQIPLYGFEEVQKTLEMVEVIQYGAEISVGSFSIKFRDAGHILGSASLEIIDSEDRQKIVFSGDLGNSPEDIVPPTEYIEQANIVVMETTYGDKNHPLENPSEILREEINKVEKSGGVLLIPAFSIERTQELLHRIHHLKKEGKVSPGTPVFMDSPMAIHATTIFRDFKQFYNDELIAHTDDPFNFEGLVITEEARDSKEIIHAMDPKVIIAGSGMLSGGRILHHATTYLQRSNTRILFVGYQAEETLGRKILEGAKNIWIHDKQLKMRASVREIASLSSHADQTKLLRWLESMANVKKVFLVHGDDAQRQVFAEIIKQKMNLNDVFQPEIGQEFNLEI